MQHYYCVYGLVLAANRAIPGLAPGEMAPTRADLQVVLGARPRDIERLLPEAMPCHIRYPDDPGHEEQLVVTRPGAGRLFHFAWGYGVDITLDAQGKRLWCTWRAPLTVADAALYLLGPAIGFILRLRGITCLHASAVLVDGAAVAITGPSGAGKSTLAASFAAGGYPVITDDVLPLVLESEAIVARPGHGRLRLTPRTLRNLPGIPADLPPIAPGWDKHALELTGGGYRQQQSPAPLQAVYILDWSEPPATTPRVEALPGTAVIPVLSAHTYRTELLDRTMRAQEFRFLGALAATVPVRRLRPVEDLAAVPSIRDLLVNDCAALPDPRRAGGKPGSGGVIRA